MEIILTYKNKIHGFWVHVLRPPPQQSLRVYILNIFVVSVGEKNSEDHSFPVVFLKPVLSRWVKVNTQGSTLFLCSSAALTEEGFALTLPPFPTLHWGLLPLSAYKDDLKCSSLQQSAERPSGPPQPPEPAAGRSCENILFERPSGTLQDLQLACSHKNICVCLGEQDVCDWHMCQT